MPRRNRPEFDALFRDTRKDAAEDAPEAQQGAQPEVTPEPVHHYWPPDTSEIASKATTAGDTAEVTTQGVSWPTEEPFGFRPTIPAPFTCRQCGGRHVRLFAFDQRLWSVCGDCHWRTLGRFEPVVASAPGYDPSRGEGHGDHH